MSIRMSAQVVICADDCEGVPDKRDRRLLKAVYEELKSRNVKVSASKILPTIRAVVIRDKRERPIWCYMQPYHIHRDLKGMHGEGTSPAIVAHRRGELMTELSAYIQDEFDRLKATDEARDKSNS